MKFLTGGDSPRVFMTESVKLRYRRYSPDERRLRLQVAPKMGIFLCHTILWEVCMNQVNQIRKNRIETATMVKISVLSVIAYLLMYIDFPLAFIAPPFIKMDISDMPALIGGFAMGPVIGIWIELFKNILHILLKGTSTGGIGELSNFLIGSIYVFTAATIYKKHKTYKGAFFGLLAGIVAMTLLATLSNYFIVFPLYAKLMVPMDTIIGMGTAVSPKIKDLWTLMIYSIAPFNVLKGLLVSAVTMLLYKRVSPILHK